MDPMFNHVAWVVTDQDAVTEFLAKYFNCTIGPKRIITGPWAEELAGIKGVHATYVGVTSPGTKTRFAILKFESPPSADNKDVAELYLKGLRHFGFIVDDIDKKTAELKADGYKFFSAVVDVEEFKSRTVYFWGPEGVVIQLAEKMK